MPKLILKAGKDTAELEVLETDSFELFQGNVFALTSVPPKNQKIMVKGKMVKVILCPILGNQPFKDPPWWYWS